MAGPDDDDEIMSDEEMSAMFDRGLPEDEAERLALDAQEMQAEAGKYAHLIKEGVWCEQEDKLIPLQIMDESDPSVGLHAPVFLAMADGYEVMPSKLLEMVRERMGDGWDDVVEAWKQNAGATPAKPGVG